MRYGHAHLQQVYHSQLRNRYQKSTESLQEFENDIARLVRLAYPETPENVLERLAVQGFIDGLRDKETKRALILARPSTLPTALASALEFEAAEHASRRQGNIRTIEDADEPCHESTEATIRRVLNEVMPKKKQLRCWHCGGLGHVRRRCDQLQNKSPEN